MEFCWIPKPFSRPVFKVQECPINFGSMLLKTHGKTIQFTCYEETKRLIKIISQLFKRLKRPKRLRIFTKSEN